MIRVRISHLALMAGIALGLAAGPATHGGYADVNLNDDAIRGTVVGVWESRGLEMGASWLYNRDSGDVGALSVHVIDLTPPKVRFKLAVGGQLFYTRTDRLSTDDREPPESIDGTALGFGGYGSYRFERAPRFSVGGSFYYAFGVVSFGDADGYYEFGAYGGYRVFERGELYLGYRRARAGWEDYSSVTIDEGVHIGFRFDF